MRKVIRQVFEDSSNYMKSGTLMLGVIEKLDEAIDFHDFHRRTWATFTSRFSTTCAPRDAGEFYTPRAITKVMVELVNPQLEWRETVMDPACGAPRGALWIMPEPTPRERRVASVSRASSVPTLLRLIRQAGNCEVEPV